MVLLTAVGLLTRSRKPFTAQPEGINWSARPLNYEFDQAGGWPHFSSVSEKTVYLVFARKYRPQSFEDVVGQSHVARTLQNAVRNNRVHHAYLFCGSRGIGKTSMARILASALNCEQGPTPEPCGECDSCRRIATGDDMDVMEIDGASNRGIDEIRDLRQNVKLSPSHSRYKIYYVDEVHMLTRQAFNALLKTLEEPPEHVKFIFSTTDPQQLPDTVKSRCQRFDFRRISDAEIVQHLGTICEKEGLDTEQGALQAVARAARGSMRDAVGTLDQVVAFGGDTLKLDDVLTVLGAARTQSLSEIVDALAQHDPGSALELVQDVLFSGVDLLDFTDQLSEYIRDLLVASYCPPDHDLLAGAVADGETLQRQADNFNQQQLIYMLQVIREAKLRARRATTGRLALEIAIAKLSQLDDLVTIQKALESLDQGQAPRAVNQQPARAGNQQTNGRPTNAGGNRQSQNNTSPSQNTDTANTGGTKKPGGSRAQKLMKRIKNRQVGAKKKVSEDNSDSADVPEATEKTPHDIDGTKFRMIQSVAETPSVAAKATEDEPLMRAFKEADARFGLEPVTLKHLREDHQDSESNPAQEKTD